MQNMKTSVNSKTESTKTNTNYLKYLGVNLSDIVAEYLKNAEFLDSRLTSKKDLFHKSMPVHLKGDDNPLSIEKKDFIKKISRLRILRIDNFDNVFIDASYLDNLYLLRALVLCNDQIVDVTPLKTLTQLVALDLSDNLIVDVTPLRTLTRLKMLVLSNNKIVDMAPLATLVNLTKLDLSGNEIVNVAPLATLVHLTVLSLSEIKSSTWHHWQRSSISQCSSSLEIKSSTWHH